MPRSSFLDERLDFRDLPEAFVLGTADELEADSVLHWRRVVAPDQQPRGAHPAAMTD
jgi:hypothetical protein